MIVVTGAAGFIGSCLVGLLNQRGYSNLILVDDFTRREKMHNLAGKIYGITCHRDEFPGWLEKNHSSVKLIFHLGARTDTREKRTSIFDALNLNYSKSIWNACTRYGIPLIYASSAATYGAGEHGYSDDHQLIPGLNPLNPYGKSKQDFDLWVLQQTENPPFWAGLKFFNVYGPNEYHKGRMASVVYHMFQQIKTHGKVELFRSHVPEFADGEQKRDFIYVLDVVEVCLHLMQQQPRSGIFNVGSGEATSFYDLAVITFKALNKAPEISFMDTPEEIRENYQYFTKAKMDKLRAAGCQFPFRTIEAGVDDYINRFLAVSAYL
ncbi:MAG: ADP-glyceromanno-heptose 6-epimerase [Bacteroidia bacterium]|nr:MAG: ADP-glyceromanno-heptose 6-epimerase [Bacteroidia bacterium]